MDVFDSVWKWLPEFTRGDLPSWAAVGLAFVAVLIAIRRSSIHAELHLKKFQFDEDGGPIMLEMEFTTYSHAARLTAEAKLKLDGVAYPMITEPFKTPTNYAHASVNTFALLFKGAYTKSETLPNTASIDVKARMSDGSKARFRRKLSLVASDDSTEPMIDADGSLS